MDQRIAIQALFKEMVGYKELAAFSIDMSKVSCPTLIQLALETNLAKDENFGIGFGPISRDKAVFGETELTIEDVRAQKLNEGKPLEECSRVNFTIPYESVVGLIDARNSSEWFWLCNN